MRLIPYITAAVIMFTAGAANAATCAEQATTKKLAGAALASFSKKCEADAAKAATAATCTKEATEKKLAGAAKASFTNKCVKDAAVKAAPVVAKAVTKAPAAAAPAAPAAPAVKK